MAVSTGALQHGDRAAREVSTRVGGNFASTTALKTLGPKYRADGMICTVATQPWIFIAGSATGASASCLVPDDVTSNSGRWKANTGSTAIEASTVPVVPGIGAVGSVGTASDAGHKHPLQPINYTYSGDAAASTTLTMQQFALIPSGATVSKVSVVPFGAAAANNTTYATVTVGHVDGAGSGGSVLATLATTVAGGSWVARTTKDMGTITSSGVTANGVLYLSIAKASTGVQLPSFTICVEFA
jgi:hypothetical protein